MVSKSKKAKATKSGVIKVANNDAPLKFSFKMFDSSDEEMCPKVFQDGYVQTLMERLKSMSGWTVLDFVTPKGKSVRNHPIDWGKTARPDGFMHLPEQLRDYPAFQFSVTANAYGRVHGLLIDDTFHVIWLDHDHRLYP